MNTKEANGHERLWGAFDRAHTANVLVQLYSHPNSLPKTLRFLHMFWKSFITHELLPVFVTMSTRDSVSMRRPTAVPAEHCYGMYEYQRKWRHRNRFNFPLYQIKLFNCGTTIKQQCILNTLNVQWFKYHIK